MKQMRVEKQAPVTRHLLTLRLLHRTLSVKAVAFADLYLNYPLYSLRSEKGRYSVIVVIVPGLEPRYCIAHPGITQYREF
jgi:hypothetical protein